MGVKTTRLPTKGPVILPRAIREGHPSDVGTELVVEETTGAVLRYLRSATRFEDVAGCLRYGGCAKTIKEMDDAISKELKQRRALGRY